VVELAGRACPLTQVENFFLTRAGQAGNAEPFVEHYLLPFIYRAGLTKDVQAALASAVAVSNLAIYGWLFLYRPLRACAFAMSSR
jgi:hypothetical protein